MGAELFEMSWVQGIVQFFNYLAWTLYVIGLIVACFECGINYAGGKGDIRAVALNAIKGFMAASLFSVVPVRLYQLAISLQAEFTSGMTGYGTSIGEVASNIIQEYEEIETVADLVGKPISGFGAVTSAIMVIVCIIMMAYPQAHTAGVRTLAGLPRRLDRYPRRVRFRKVQGSRQQRCYSVRGLYNARSRRSAEGCLACCICFVLPVIFIASDE